MKKATIRNVICDCGNDVYHKEHNEDAPIWICDNCRKQTKRRVMPSKAAREAAKVLKQSAEKDAIRAEVREIAAAKAAGRQAQL